MIRDCERCGITFESEGHKLGELLNLCGFCNDEIKPQESQDAQELNEHFGVTE